MFSSFGSELADKESRSLEYRNVPTEEGRGLITGVQKFSMSWGHTMVCGNVSNRLCWCLFVKGLRFQVVLHCCSLKVKCSKVK